MTKAELIAKVAEETGVTKTAAATAVDTLVNQAAKALKKEGRMALFGLGILSVVSRKKRTGRNPQTGAPVTIKAHKAVKFKAAKSLKDTLNPSSGR